MFYLWKTTYTSTFALRSCIQRGIVPANEIRSRSTDVEDVDVEVGWWGCWVYVGWYGTWGVAGYLVVGTTIAVGGRM